MLAIIEPLFLFNLEQTTMNEFIYMAWNTAGILIMLLIVLTWMAQGAV